MSNFVRNIKEHKIAALVCFGLLAAIAVYAVMAIKNERSTADLSSSDTLPQAEQSQTKVSEHFDDGDYPVKVTSSGDKLILELDGSKSPDVKWVTVSDDAEQAVVKAENDGEEEEGRLVSVITPVAVGYATVTYSRSGESGGVAYNIVELKADVYVSADKDNNLSIALSDIRQSIPTAGALDSDTPFLLEENKVVLPNGGDWYIVVLLADGAPTDLYNITRNAGDGTMEYIMVEKNTSSVKGDDLEDIMRKIDDSKLVLVNETLGYQHTLKCELNDEKIWALSLSDEEVELPFDKADSDTDSSDESEESSSK